MICIKGNKTEEISPENLVEISNSYKSVEIDLGTGDGRFIYEQAQKHRDTFFVGIDPSQKQLEIYSKKANKSKLDNTLFVVGSIEVLPDLPEKFADKIYMNLPWGSLLKEVVHPTAEYFLKLKQILKTSGIIEIVFGYDEKLEPSQVQRLGVEDLSEEKINSQIIPRYENLGFERVAVETLSKDVLKQLATTWSKKLGFGHNRPIFKLVVKSPVE